MIHRAGAAQPLKRSRAPTITVDTSALNNEDGMSIPMLPVVPRSLQRSSIILPQECPLREAQVWILYMFRQIIMFCIAARELPSQPYRPYAFWSVSA